MNLNASMILGLLEHDRSRYIERDMGRYRLKEANGADVLVDDNGRQVPVEPMQIHMDDLERESRLVRDGSRYRLPPK
jgi:hypothetical protein